MATLAAPWQSATIRDVSATDDNVGISNTLTYNDGGSPGQTGRGSGLWFGRYRETIITSVQFGVIHETCEDQGFVSEGALYEIV
jgi:hypothetical protein